MLLLSFSFFINTSSAAWVSTHTVNNDDSFTGSAAIGSGENISISVELNVGSIDSSGANNSLAYLKLTGSGYNELNIWVYSDGVQVNIFQNYGDGFITTLQELLTATISTSDTVTLEFVYGGDCFLFVNDELEDSFFIAGDISAYSNLVEAVVGCTSGDATFTVSNNIDLVLGEPVTYTATLISQVYEGSIVTNGTVTSNQNIEGVGHVVTVEVNASDILSIGATPLSSYKFDHFSIAGFLIYGTYYANPTYINVQSDFTATAHFTSTTTPPPFEFDLNGTTLTFMSLLYLAIAAVFSFLGLLILLKASGSWIVGLILLLVGFFLTLLAMPNLYGLLGFSLEAIVATVMLYASKGGGKQSK